MQKLKVVLISLCMMFTTQVYAENNDTVIIPKDTMLIGKLITPAHSKYSKKGGPLLFSIDKGFNYDQLEVIPHGLTGKAVVVDKQKAGYFGVGGKIVFEPQSLILRNGVVVPLYFKTGKHGSRENDTNMALGVVGLGIFSGFLHGANQKFPAGTKFEIYVKDDVTVGKYSELKKIFN